jgi:hypothetical protein
MNNETVLSYRPVRQRKAGPSDLVVSVIDTAATVIVTLAAAAFIIGTYLATR